MQTPNDLSLKLEELAADYGAVCERLGTIGTGKAETWLKIREGTTSDRQADKLWEATLSGREEVGLRWRERGLLRQMSAIRTRLRVLSDEVKNMY